MKYLKHMKFQYSNISRGNIGILESRKITLFQYGILSSWNVTMFQYFQRKYWNIRILKISHIRIFTEKILKYNLRKYWEISWKIPMENTNIPIFPLDILYLNPLQFQYSNISRGNIAILESWKIPIL